MFLLVGAALVACQPAAEKTEESSYKLWVVKPENRTLKSEYTASLAGRQVVEIRPQVSGFITRICIEEGAPVRKGQVLFVIDQVPYLAALQEAEAGVKNAEAALATAQLDWKSKQVLREKNIVSDYDLNLTRNALAAAEATLAQAKAQEVNARNNLSYTEVKSPTDGVAGMIAYRVGALVSSSIDKPLVTVSDNSRMYAYFSLTEEQIIDQTERYGSLEAFIRQAPEVELRMAGGRLYKEKGHIAAVSGIVTAGTGSVTVRADFPNPQGLLRNGGNGTVIVPAVREQCIAIPQGATYELQNRRFVYKVVNGKTQSAPITVCSLNNGTEFIVEEGLQPGDTIIAEGAGLVSEGIAVTSANKEEE